MSDRLTNRWTPTLEQAFGETGKKGTEGEIFLLSVFKNWGWETRWYENDRSRQVAGIDIEFRSPKWVNFYSCDCKNNMDQYGRFYVYKDWLFKIKSDRVFHVNPTTGWFLWYGVKEMREYYKQRGRDREYIVMYAHDVPRFVKRSRKETNNGC